jgi:hypothetical protein
VHGTAVEQRHVHQDDVTRVTDVEHSGTQLSSLGSATCRYLHHRVKALTFHFPFPWVRTSVDVLRRTFWISESY